LLSNLYIANDNEYRLQCIMRDENTRRSCHEIKVGSCLRLDDAVLVGRCRGAG
jgi:hypothetical protein